MPINPNTPQYWDKIYSSEGHTDPNLRNDPFSFEVINSYLPNEGKFLDVGCGSGYLLSFISRKRQKLQLYGSDFSSRGVKIAQKRVSAEFTTASIYDLPYQDHEFDVVTTTEVLEHLSDIDKAVSELSRVTKTLSLNILPYKDYVPSDEHVAEYDQESIKVIFSKHFTHVFTDIYTNPAFLANRNGLTVATKLLLVEARHENSD
jgi:ubiquinone/menaquinone biosynthesis C-methylase UbiE